MYIYGLQSCDGDQMVTMHYLCMYAVAQRILQACRGSVMCAGDSRNSLYMWPLDHSNGGQQACVSAST